MEGNRPVIMLVGEEPDLPQSYAQALYAAFERVTPIISCIGGDRFMAVHDKIEPDLVIITNFDLGNITAYEVVKAFPKTKFIILYDGTTKKQAEVLGVTMVEKPTNLSRDFIPAVVDLITQ